MSLSDFIGYTLIASIAIVWTVLLCMIYRNRPRSNPEQSHRANEGRW